MTSVSEFSASKVPESRSDNLRRFGLKIGPGSGIEFLGGHTGRAEAGGQSYKKLRVASDSGKASDIASCTMY